MQRDGHDTDIVLERLSSLLDLDGACGANIYARHAHDAVVGAGGLSLDLAPHLDEVVHIDGACLGAQPVSFTYIMVNEHIRQMLEPIRSAHRVFY